MSGLELIAIMVAVFAILMILKMPIALCLGWASLSYFLLLSDKKFYYYCQKLCLMEWIHLY